MSSNAKTAGLGRARNNQNVLPCFPVLAGPISLLPPAVAAVRADLLRSWSIRGLSPATRNTQPLLCPAIRKFRRISFFLAHAGNAMRKFT
jgi:hypothetical protein